MDINASYFLAESLSFWKIKLYTESSVCTEACRLIHTWPSVGRLKGGLSWETQVPQSFSSYSEGNPASSAWAHTKQWHLVLPELNLKSPSPASVWCRFPGESPSRLLLECRRVCPLRFQREACGSLSLTLFFSLVFQFLIYLEFCGMNWFASHYLSSLQALKAPALLSQCPLGQVLFIDIAHLVLSLPLSLWPCMFVYFIPYIILQGFWKRLYRNTCIWFPVCIWTFILISFKELFNREGAEVRPLYN